MCTTAGSGPVPSPTTATAGSGSTSPAAGSGPCGPRARLAAAVDLFRRRYGIDETEPDAVPVDYREKSLGAELQSRVTALHKSTVLRERAAAAPFTLADRLREHKRVEAEARLEHLRHAGLTAHTQESTTDDKEHRLRDDNRARGDDGRER